jgi:hypothetical protein
MTGASANPLARGASGVVAKARAIKEWTRAIGALPDDAVVSVSELSCTLPGCPPRETVILVMHGGKTHQASIHKTMLEVTKDDVELALSVPATGLD